jgi:general secretion pathway protein F
LAAQLLAVGEETGELARMFERLAEIYEQRTRETLKRFTALFEPLVILALGIVVGIMILSILTALTSIQRMGLQ